jgi:hypothetical protein
VTRCLACSQENCGYKSSCSCDCHGAPSKVVTPYKVPDGWKFEQLKPESLEQVLLQSTPSAGMHTGYMATIDFARRLFRSGLVMHGSGVKEYAHRKYEGRGWRQKLVDDAVEWMRSIDAKKKGERKR